MGLYKNICDIEASRIRVAQKGNFNQTVITKTVSVFRNFRTYIAFILFQVVKDGRKGLEAVVDLKKKINIVLEQTGDYILFSEINEKYLETFYKETN